MAEITFRRFSEETKAKMSVAKRGENNPRAVFTEEDVRFVKQELANGATATELAGMLGCNVYRVKDIKRGRTWAHVRP